MNELITSWQLIVACFLTMIITLIIAIGFCIGMIGSLQGRLRYLMILLKIEGYLVDKDIERVKI